MLSSLRYGGLLLALGLLFTQVAWSQEERFDIPVHLQQKKITELVQLVEQNSKWTFYFDERAMDSISITINMDSWTIRTLLETALKNTPYQFIFFGDRNVYITERRFRILQTLNETQFIQKSRSEPVNTPNKEDKPTTDSRQPIDAAENRLYEIGPRTSQLTGNTVLAGYVRDQKSGEPVAGASIYLENGKAGAVTDAFGFYSISLPRGRHIIRISSTGMKPTKREIVLYNEGRLLIEMKEDIPTLKTVTVVAERNSNVKRMQMGVERLNIKTIKSVPVLMGEPDVLKVLLTLPGVTSVGEASSGFNVRGGSTDQNLILFNDATIYNPSHVFGFFSSFNPDVIKTAELYKGSIPERFGGRISSVLDITTREGNAKKWSGSAGVGILTSKIMLEGPIKKDKTTLLLGARTTYSDWILKRLPGKDYRNSSASFYDTDLHLTHTFNSKNSLYLTAYLSSDQFRLNNDTTFRYGNRNTVVKWKHIFSNKFNMTWTAGTDHYGYSVTGDENTIRSYKLRFDLDQFHIRTDFNLSAGNDHQINFGAQSIRYNIAPGTYMPRGTSSLVVKETLEREQAMESALYFGDRINISPRLSANAGIRYSFYQYLGPKKLYSYIDGLPRDESTRLDSTSYPKGKPIQNYHGPEIRLSLRYSIGENASIKMGYNTLRQYLHLLSNTTSISPTDIWKLSDPFIKPQKGEQYSIGWYQNAKDNKWEFSMEWYFKRMKNYLDYKSGAQVVMNAAIETDVVNTRGKSYGVELMLRKPAGKLNGWFSYTWSRVLLQQDDSLSLQQINKGAYYPANFDKPHAINLVANYKFSHRYSIAANVQYSTGRPITLPIAVFNLAGAQRVFYSQRNQYRIPDYFRADLAFNIEGNHRVKQKTHNSWSLGVYNLTGRKNPYSIYFVEENGQIKGYKLSVIGAIIPYITFNIRF